MQLLAAILLKIKMLLGIIGASVAAHFLALEKPLNIWEELLPAVDLHLAAEVE